MSGLKTNVTAAAAGSVVGAPAVPNWDTTPNPPDGTVGVAYNYNLGIHLNTTQGVVITVTGGVLPSGLIISGLAIDGTPDTQELASGLQFTATNVSGADESIAVDIDIATVVSTGDITATDPLGLSAGQDIAWTIQDEEPPPAGAKRFNTGHYLRVQGDTMGDGVTNDQPGYIDKVLTTISNRMSDSVNILGAHVGLAWGNINPTGNTFDFTDFDVIMDAVKADGNKQLIIQLQFKAFGGRTVPTFEAPADLLGSEVFVTNTGLIAAVWKTSVMTRYIACIQAIADHADLDDNFEMLIMTETAPSFSQVDTSGYGYDESAYTVELKRCYTEAEAFFTKANWAPNINSLGGTGNGNKVPELMEHCYQIRSMVAGPDAQPTIAWNNFEGIATGPVAPTRDYRNHLGTILVASNQVLNVETPTQVILNLQSHEATHCSWISGNQTHSWDGDIIPAIDANPGLHSACPTRYASCET